MKIVQHSDVTLFVSRCLKSTGRMTRFASTRCILYIVYAKNITDKLGRCEGRNTIQDVIQLEFGRRDEAPFTIQIREISFEMGGLGCRLFPSALIMCEWMKNMPQFFRNRDVLELGSGVGTCGFMAAHLGCRSVILTDYYLPLLESLHASAAQVAENCPNVEIKIKLLDWNSDFVRWVRIIEGQNGNDELKRCFSNDLHLEQHSHERQHHASSHSSLRGVDGSAHITAICESEKFDVLLATDVLYESIQADLLASVLSLRLRVSAICLMVLPIRDPGVLQRMISLQFHAGLKISICSVEFGFNNQDWWNIPQNVAQQNVYNSDSDGIEKLLQFIANLSSVSHGVAGVFLCITSAEKKMSCVQR